MLCLINLFVHGAGPPLKLAKTLTNLMYFSQFVRTESDELMFKIN